MLLIQAQELSFAYYQHAERLLHKLNFQIAPGSRIGLIGANGAGKSTLLRLLRGELTADSGQLYRKPGLKLGWLPQDPLINEKGLAMSLVWALRPELEQLRQTFLDPSADSDELVKALEAYEGLGGYAFEMQLDRFLAAFSWDAEVLNRRVETFSGGEKTRLALLLIALDQPDLLLLDEPGNHLDQTMIDWLEDYLVTLQIPWLMISHDRHLLEGCVETIWELEAGKLTIRRGNYSSYRRDKEHLMAHQTQLYELQRKKARQLEQVAASRRAAGEKMERFKPSRSIKKNGGICARDEGSVHAQLRTRNLMRAAKAAEHRAERVETQAQLNRPASRRDLSLSFRSNQLRVRHVLRVQDLASVRDGRKLFSGLDLILAPGSRLAICGVNGSGKSSLMELLAGRLKPDQGQFQWAEGIRIGYFAQDIDSLNSEQNAIEAVLQGEPGRMTLARTLLACLGFGQDQLRQPIQSLSSGERGKVALAALVAAEPEVLLLDEPTNHLELPAREALEQALLAYTGSIIFVSHDRWFREAIATDELWLGQV
ncbi:MAG: hypothetical protein CVV27_06600 [Candidatus Melainabacteria bacterium HGW-Melainabacteria-1]|nr:MAG: hypothetical protein CVV27_06600 [Candidatus Melainabacteria bacterium HGW-Melainabacteria-1]